MKRWPSGPTRLLVETHSSAYLFVFFTVASSGDQGFVIPPPPFRFVLVIGLENGENKGEPPVPTLDYRFPPMAGKNEATGTIDSILQFCWPDVDTKKVRKKKKSRPKTFRFVLTEADGAKKFGYCLRSLPDKAKTGKKKRFAECICIVSRLPCFALFDPLLHLIEGRRNNGTRSDVFVLLQSIRARSMPLPGQVLHLQRKRRQHKCAFLSQTALPFLRL